jgi:glutathione S-transferase
MTMQLYNYFRSSASYRVRIALALKGLAYDYMPVHLTKNEQFTESYAAVSAARLVPLLKDGDALLTQSLAIIEYLDETHPTPALLPADPLGRARVRALAYDIACEIHPLNNLRVLRYLVHDLRLSEDDAGTGIGSRPGWRPSSASSAMRAAAVSAMAMCRRWPTSRWCRRSTTPGAWPAGSTTCPP